MNPQENKNWERRLQELEVEINQSSSPSPVTQNDKSQQTETLFAPIRDWFNSLPTPGKVGVAIVAVVAAFSLLNSILRLVALLLSIAILGGLLYLLYKFLIAPNSSE